MRGVTCAGTKLQRFRVLQSGAKLFETLVHPPPPPQKQCCCHDTSPYGSLKSIIQHCQWGEGGNSQQKIEVPVCGHKYVKMEKIFRTREVSLFLLVIVVPTQPRSNSGMSFLPNLVPRVFSASARSYELRRRDPGWSWSRVPPDFRGILIIAPLKHLGMGGKGNCDKSYYVLK